MSQTNPHSGILGALFGNIFDAVNRTGARLGDITDQAQGKQLVNPVNQKMQPKQAYLSQSDQEYLSHPLNQAKDFATTGSFINPVGGLGGTIASGAMAGFGGAQGNDVGTALKDALYGGALGGATHGILGLAGKGLSNLGESQAIKKFGTKLADKGQNAEYSAVAKAFGGNPTKAEGGLDLLKSTIIDHKYPTTSIDDYLSHANNILSDSKGSIGDISKQLAEKGVGLSKSDLISYVDNKIANEASDLQKAPWLKVKETLTKDLGDLNDNNLALDHSYNLKKAYGQAAHFTLGNNSAENSLSNAYQDLYGHLNDLHDNAFNQNGFTQFRQLNSDVSNAIKAQNYAQRLQNKVPGGSPLTDPLQDAFAYGSLLTGHPAGGIMGMAANKAINSPMGQKVIAKSFQKVGNGLANSGAAGSLFSKAGNGLSKLSAMPILGTAASNIVQSQPTNQERNDQFFNNSQQQSPQSSTSPMSMQNGMNSQSSMQGGQMGMDINQLRDRRNQLARQIAMQTDAKGNLVYKPSEAIEQANAIMMSQGANPMALGGANSMKPLSGSDQKAYSQAQNGIDSLDQVAALLKGGNGALAQSSLLPGIFQSSNARQYQNAVSTAAMNLGYLQSGANVSPEERKRIESLFPSWHDDEATKQAKLASLYNQFAMAKPQGGMQMQQQQY